MAMYEYPMISPMVYVCNETYCTITMLKFVFLRFWVKEPRRNGENKTKTKTSATSIIGRVNSPTPIALPSCPECTALSRCTEPHPIVILSTVYTELQCLCTKTNLPCKDPSNPVCSRLTEASLISSHTPCNTTLLELSWLWCLDSTIFFWPTVRRKSST